MQAVLKCTVEHTRLTNVQTYVYVYMYDISNLVEAHCYGTGMAGQFLSKPVAVKQVESKTS